MTDPLPLFENWYAAARSSEPSDPNACALATVRQTPDGPRPDVRVVLMKQFDARGFAFFTNYGSAKGRQLDAVPHAVMNFHWKSLARQIRVTGAVERATDAEGDAYFARRYRQSQLSAWASDQSQPLDSRTTFEERLAKVDSRFPGAVPRPPFWGGFRLVPAAIEFWEDRDGRQHHRQRFDRDGTDWRWSLIYP